MKNINLFTHGGIFHADEVFASVVLCSVFEKNYSEIKRVFRVPDDISDSDIVYDIGGGKFDHHQREGNGVRDNGIPYASAGLIWKRYGEYFLILQAADLSKNFWNPDWNTENIKKLWKTVDKCFVQSIDAIDNGIKSRDGYNVSSIISSYNPAWNEEEDADSAFVQACDMMEKIFFRFLKSKVSILDAENIITEAFHHAKDRVMVLPQFAPWQNTLLDLDEKEKILFVVFPSSRGGYMVQTVPVSPESFEFRKGLKTEWRGLRENDLVNVSGISDAVFVHPNGFIGSANSLEGAVKMAKISINQSE